MGISSLSLSLLLAATPLAVQPVSSPVDAEPIAEVHYLRMLQSDDLAQLQQACRDAARFGLKQRLQDLRDRLMLVAPAPQPFVVVTANTRALLACKAPESAQRVLSRYGPGSGLERQQWLVLSWRAAAAALDHQRAILALRRLAEGDLSRLERVQLPLVETATGLTITRLALDQLAEHEAAAGRIDRAAAVALSAPSFGREGAARLARAALWLEELGQNDATNLLETALDQAAAAEAWSLAEDLLRIQLRLERKAGGDGARPRARLERLATRLDDRYTLWQLIREDSDSTAVDQRRMELERQLRSPRRLGGSSSLGESD